MTEDADPALWDVDLLIGRDPATAVRVEAADLARWMTAANVESGLLCSQRAIVFDLDTGNEEASRTAEEISLQPVWALQARDYLGSRTVLEALAPGSVVRFAPQRQDTPVHSPGFRSLVRQAAAAGHLLLCEGDIREVGPALSGLDAQVVFLDTHFYALGDFVALAEAEPGFHTSIRLLVGPDSLERIRDEVGIERLVFGSRNGFHEGRAVLERFRAAELSAAERAAVASGNLRRLTAGRPVT